MVIGIIGGVGSGKSTILDYLEKNYDAYIIQADLVAKEIMKPGYSAFDTICNKFPEVVYDNKIDNNRLAEVVFNNKDKLKLLNSITHPATINEIINRIKKYQENQVVVVESAILPGTGIEDYCDELWFIYCEKEKRIKRLMDSRGYSREKAESIIHNQPSDDEYNRLADEFIDNSYSQNETHEKIDLILSMMPCSF